MSLPSLDDGDDSVYDVENETLCELSGFVLDSEFWCHESHGKRFALPTRRSRVGVRSGSGYTAILSTCRVRANISSGIVAWLIPVVMVSSQSKEVMCTLQQTVLVVCRVAKWTFSTVESSSARTCLSMASRCPSPLGANQSFFQSYSSGMLNVSCGTKFDHSVLAVEHGMDAGSEYRKVVALSSVVSFVSEGTPFSSF